MEETLDTTIDRFYTLLTYDLMAQMPRPGGIHKYSTGNMLANFSTSKTPDGWIIEISKGVNYSGMAMGYNDDGSKRSPRGPLESINFRTIENCLRDVSSIISSGSLGGVFLNDNRVY
ncbi:MAG: hypothetical protein K6A63_02230 [Acholeplasmatales bacterium]|nr:hypothetical protein [Acholeplasmatales bacterium]